MPRVFVVRTTDDYGRPITGVFERLVAGEARIGWSYQDDLDLRMIAESRQLNEAQAKAARCLPFLQKVSVGDYLLYPHQPERNSFAVVRVTGDYDYKPAAESIDDDFRSFRPCSLETPDPIDWNDDIVPLRLKRAMGLPGRFYEISDLDGVEEVLRRKSAAGQIAPGNLTKGIERLQIEARPLLAAFNSGVSALIQHEFRQHDFSLLCHDLFTRMGLQSEYQEGAYEYGADIVLTIQSVVLPVEIRIGVQAFAYIGDVTLGAFTQKLDQLIAGWEKNSLDYGLLITTVVCGAECWEKLRHHNHDHPARLIKLVDGSQLAQLFLQPYFTFLSEQPSG